MQIHTLENILPLHLRIPPSKRKDILMDIAALHTAEHGGPEGAVSYDLQLHATANGLGNSVCPAQRLHLHSILGGAPGEQAGLERMCG